MLQTGRSSPVHVRSPRPVASGAQDQPRQDSAGHPPAERNSSDTPHQQPASIRVGHNARARALRCASIHAAPDETPRLLALLGLLQCLKQPRMIVLQGKHIFAPARGDGTGIVLLACAASVTTT
ncbi:MAG: hypothetical protein NZM04_09575 [Methylacidiphilales bacterium]|nr:hypothetical protein [Candidatus Methylacidiphilales bacterium]